MIKTWNISIKDIDDIIEYLTHLKKFKNLPPSEIIKYIKLLNEEHMKKFESFS